MPDKPTDKLTFVEWVAKDESITTVQVERILLVLYQGLIHDGLHSACDKRLGSSPGCSMCWLEGWLTEYHKYFKQNK